MDKDRIVGSAKQIKGTVKQVVGKAVGDTKLKAEGMLTKLRGRFRTPSAASRIRLKENRQLRAYSSRCLGISPITEAARSRLAGGIDGFESVEISTPPKRACGILASDCGRCNCGRRDDPRSPCIRCRHGFSPYHRGAIPAYRRAHSKFPQLSI